MQNEVTYRMTCNRSTSWRATSSSRRTHGLLWQPGCRRPVYDVFCSAEPRPACSWAFHFRQKSCSSSWTWGSRLRYRWHFYLHSESRWNSSLCYFELRFWNLLNIIELVRIVEALAMLSLISFGFSSLFMNEERPPAHGHILRVVAALGNKALPYVHLLTGLWRFVIRVVPLVRVLSLLLQVVQRFAVHLLAHPDRLHDRALDRRVPVAPPRADHRQGRIVLVDRSKIRTVKAMFWRNRELRLQRRDMVPIQASVVS